MAGEPLCSDGYPVRMIDPSAPPHGKLYRSGPWLILYGHGPESEAHAQQIATQCESREVDFELATADEVNPRILRSFTALLVVLPSSTAGERARSLTQLVEIIKAYRARKPEGLTHLLQGRRWYEVGIVQVFDDATAPTRPAIQSIMDIVCYYHQVQDGDELTPFAPYVVAAHDQPDPAGPAAGPPVGDYLARSAEKLRATIRLWGIEWSQPEVTAIRQFIDELRDHWEDPKFSDLYRPITGAERNRLDFMLDEPAFSPPEDTCPRKKWMEGGQRVLARVLAELQKKYPNVHCPPGRERTRGKQKDFQELYRALHAAEEILYVQRSPTS